MTAVGSDGMEAFCCPMCLDLLEDPLILNCGDTMCSRCVAACIAHECASILASQSGASAKIMGDDPWNSQKQPSAGVPNDTCTTKSASEPVGIPAIVGIKCARCSMITNAISRYLAAKSNQMYKHLLY
ncbi:hypothetical protein Pelo_4964 [Pelomyxa schiedti]|nr:hypothetical protein Pelo_4964 [Pelomyxa schiedti]